MATDYGGIDFHDAPKGSSVQSFAEYLCMMAKRANARQFGTFNDATVVAYVGSDPKDIAEKFDMKMKIRRLEARLGHVR